MLLHFDLERLVEFDTACLSGSAVLSTEFVFVAASAIDDVVIASRASGYLNG